MNILYVAPEYLPIEIAVSIRSSFNVAALLDKGHNVTVVSTGESRVGRWGETVYGISIEPPSNRNGLALRLLKEIRVGIGFCWYIARRRKAYDLVVITSPPFFEASLIALLLRLLGIRYVVDIRDRYPTVFFSQGLVSPHSYLGRLLSGLEAAIYRKAEAVTTVTKTLQKDIHRDTSVEPELVQNGYDQALFFSLNYSKFDSDFVRIVRHGTFGQFFDVETFIKIASYCSLRAPPHEFLLIGSGHALDRVRDAALKNVVIRDAMAQSLIAEELRKSHIGLSIMPYNESALGSFPVKVFEYIGSGLPVMMIPVGEAGSEISENGFGRAYSNEDWEDAALWLTDFIKSKQLRQGFAGSVQSRGKDYSRQSQSARFASIVERSCDRGHIKL